VLKSLGRATHIRTIANSTSVTLTAKLNHIRLSGVPSHTSFTAHRVELGLGTVAGRNA
jgi:hypothetical protein